jgi:hypothetical protein
MLGTVDTPLFADGADDLDPEVLAVAVDEIDYFMCWRSSSVPKNGPPALRISVAARISSRFSWVQFGDDTFSVGPRLAAHYSGR